MVKKNIKKPFSKETRIIFTRLKAFGELVKQNKDEKNMIALFDIFTKESISSCASTLFIFLILTSPYRCDKSDSILPTGSVNVTNNFIVNSKASGSSKSGIDNSNNNQATFTSEDITQNSQQIPLVRLPSNTLLKYTAYKDVSIQHFLIPMDSRSALFTFKAYEESKSALSEYIFRLVHN